MTLFALREGADENREARESVGAGRVWVKVTSWAEGASTEGGAGSRRMESEYPGFCRLYAGVLRRTEEQRISGNRFRERSTPYGCTVHRDGVASASQYPEKQTARPATYIELPATETSTCPVRAMRYYCQARDAARPSSSALFVMESGARRTRWRLNGILRQSLGQGFSSHSLRFGLAASAAAAGVADNVLQRLGRWRSEAYNGYVRGRRQVVTAALRAVARS